MKPWSVWIGFDPREADAFAVARASIVENLYRPTRVGAVILSDLQESGIYRRPTTRVDGRLHDVISEHPMATEFAISRFLVPHLARNGLALFVDCDVLARRRVDDLFDIAGLDDSKAVWVVKHRHEPADGQKMDGQIQSRYARKNWSSVMLFNVDHPSNRHLTIDMVNTLPGRDLHRFCWLDDDEIGDLSVEWNWLVGHSPDGVDPGIVHFTDGIPTMPGYGEVAYADEWRDSLSKWARYTEYTVG